MPKIRVTWETTVIEKYSGVWDYDDLVDEAGGPWGDDFPPLEDIRSGDTGLPREASGWNLDSFFAGGETADVTDSVSVTSRAIESIEIVAEEKG